MSEEVKQEFPPIIDGTYKKDEPHKDIGKQKFRVRQYYNAWVEYDVVAETKDEAIDAVIEHGGIEKIEWQEGYHKDEPVEVYANDYNYVEQDDTVKVEECVPYEDYDVDTGKHFDNYEDPEWTSDDYRWKKEEEPA
jgi:hypothetical protein